MILTQTGVSQVSTFDPDQPGGCPRKFWFERVQHLKPEQSSGQSDGEAGHALLRDYFSTGAMPGRARMGKTVTAAILKGDLPKPGPDLFVETRFDGSASMWRDLPCDRECLDYGMHPDCDLHGEEPKREWIPFNAALTFKLGGLDWDGAIDLSYRRGVRPVVLDHKFCSDLDLYPPVPRERLIKTVQLPIYVLAMARRWSDAREWVIGHNNVGKTASHGSRLIREIVTIDQVRERGEQIAGLVQQMRAVAAAESQEDVPFNRRSCHSWTGCAHQAICSAFRGNKMNLSAEDQAMFDALEGVTPDAAPAAAPAPSLQELDAAAAKAKRIAALQAELAAEQNAAPVVVAAPAKVRPQIVDVAPPPVQIPDSAQPGPAPVASVPAPFPPCANACGVTLDASNASRLQSGAIKHIGCPKDAPPPAAAAPAKRGPGRPPKVPPPCPSTSPAGTAVGAALAEVAAPQSIAAAVLATPAPAPAPADGCRPAPVLPRIPATAGRIERVAFTPKISVTLEFETTTELAAFFAAR